MDDLDKTLATSHEHVQVLPDFEDVKVRSIVDRSHINSIFFTLIQEIQSYDAIIESVEQIISAVWVNWQSFLELLMPRKLLIDQP